MKIIARIEPVTIKQTLDRLKRKAEAGALRTIVVSPSPLMIHFAVTHG